MRLVFLIVFFLPISLSAQDTVSTAPKKDIFFIFDVYVKDKETGTPIPNCTVTLIGSDGTQVIKTTDSTGKISFDKNGEERYIKKETSYNFEVIKKDYLPAKSKFSTIGKTTSMRFVEEVFLLYTIWECTLPIPFSEIQFNFKSFKYVDNLAVNKLLDSLALVFQTLIDNPNLILEIQGHSDCTEKDFDKKLSQKRAQVCVDYLVAKGIPKERLVAVGHGSEKPRMSGYECETVNAIQTKEEQEKFRQLNRRVQFRMLSFDYKPTTN